MALNALNKRKCLYVGLLDFCYTTACVAECILYQQSNRGEPAYYVLLHEALPELGLYLTTARYYRSAYPPQGRWVFRLLPTAFFVAPGSYRGASATGAHAEPFLALRSARLPSPGQRPV